MTLSPRLDDLLELRHQARTLGLASHHLVNSSFSGLYASVFRGQGLNFEEVREYREGDDIRNMDWKVTARTGDPHLKVFREERERSVMLCVDVGPHMNFGTRGTFKSVQAARAAALLGWAANSLHDRVGGLLFGSREQDNVYFGPTKDRRALWRLLKALTGTAEEGGEPPPEMLSNVLQRASRGIGTGGLVFVIADFNREHKGLRKGLSQLRQHHSVVLLPVDDVADRELPDMGEVLFRGPDGELLSVNTTDPAGRRAYQEAWQQRRERLTKLANGAGCALIPLDTREDVHRSLRQGLERRQRMRGFL
ncbi:MAG TPA: DUF58 domain-containing protein [Gammaproteobacteria bacterium]|nr:DUF58 domain-containing protein [Gammaproteobacteria bacterium]